MYVLCAFVLHDMNVDDGGGCYGGYVGDGVVGCYGGLLVMVVLVVNLLRWCWLLWWLNWLCWCW